MKVPVGTTFVVAASLLGAAAVAQLIAVLVYFAPQFRAPAPQPVAVSPAATPAPAASGATPAPVATPAPTPVDEAALARKQRVAELLKEAEKLEKGSEPADALVPLEEAAGIDERNAEVLTRLASLQERFGKRELAEGTWRSILDLGPDAGRYLDVAEVRLRLLVQQGAAPKEGMELRDQVGLRPESDIGIVDLSVTDENGGEIKDLRIAVKSRPGKEIDLSPGALRIDVIFYEDVDGEIQPTTSRVQHMWYTAPVDWKDDGIEILQVKYQVPSSGKDGGPPPKFYGYMVNIYYHGDLQETRADPFKLEEMFEPALKLGEGEGPAASQEAAGVSESVR